MNILTFERPALSTQHPVPGTQNPKPQTHQATASPYPRDSRTAMEVFEGLPESTSRIQLINGLIVTEPAPVYVHQDMLADINYELSSFVRRHQLGKVLVSPVDVYFTKEDAFQPDILFVSNERLSIIKKNGIYGAPDLVVEILSPSTASYDRHHKKRVYEQYGVKEYWLVDPETRAVEGFELKNGAFQALPPARGIMDSVLLGEKFRF